MQFTPIWKVYMHQMYLKELRVRFVSLKQAAMAYFDKKEAERDEAGLLIVGVLSALGALLMEVGFILRDKVKKMRQSRA